MGKFSRGNQKDLIVDAIAGDRDLIYDDPPTGLTKTIREHNPAGFQKTSPSEFVVLAPIFFVTVTASVKWEDGRSGRGKTQLAGANKNNGMTEGAGSF